MSEARMARVEDLDRHAITLPYEYAPLLGLFDTGGQTRRRTEIPPESLTVEFNVTLSEVKAAVCRALAARVGQVLTDAVVADVNREVVAALNRLIDRPAAPLAAVGYDWRRETERLRRVEEAYQAAIAEANRAPAAEAADQPIVVAKNVFAEKE